MVISLENMICVLYNNCKILNLFKAIIRFLLKNVAKNIMRMRIIVLIDFKEIYKANIANKNQSVEILVYKSYQYFKGGEK